MAYSTECLVCKPAGQGWSIQQIFYNDRMVLAETLMEKWNSHDQNFGGLSKWLKDTCKDTYRSDPCLVSAVYLYQLEAPGQWCQIFWECHDEASAKQLREKLYGFKADMFGYYLVNRCLSDLTGEEKRYYQKTVIDA